MTERRMKDLLSSRRKICFEAVTNDAIVEIENSADFSEKERQRCWYSKTELENIHVRSKRDAAKKRPSCRRGLELLTQDGKNSMLVATHACIDAVMDEQESQWENDCDDFNRLALASQEVSEHSMQEAIERAIKDEKVARKIHREDSGPPPLPIRKERLHNDEPELSVMRPKESNVCVDLGTLYQNPKHVRHADHIVPIKSLSISSTTTAFKRAKAA